MRIRRKHILRTLGVIFVTPLLLVCLVVVLAYLPPVQRWLINEVGSRMEESLGMRVHVDDVRITPFLDLVADGVTAVDTEGDTLLATQRLTFDLAFRPLFDGKADVRVLQLEGTRLNTKSLISDCRIVGTVGDLVADAQGIEWPRSYGRIPHIALSDADLQIVLTDTAAVDSTAEPLQWIFDIEDLKVDRSRLALSLPPDTLGTAMTADIHFPSAQAQHVHLDLGQPLYSLQHIEWDAARMLLTSDAVMPTGERLVPPAARRDTLLHLAFGKSDVDSLSYDSLGALRCNIRASNAQELHYSRALTPRLQELTGVSPIGEKFRPFVVSQIAGHVYLDADRFEVPALSVVTPTSRITAGIGMDWAALQTGAADGESGNMSLHIDAALGRSDVRDMLDIAVKDGYLDPALLKNSTLQPFFDSDINLKATLSGNMSHLRVEDYALTLPRLLTARGNLDVRDDFNAYAGRITASLNGGTVSGRFNAHLRRETFEVDAVVRNFPVGRFVDGMDVTPFSGRLNAKGHGFDVTSARSALSADLDVQRLSVSGFDLSGLQGRVGMREGIADIAMRLSNDLGNMNGHFDADLRHGYDVAGTLAVDELRLDRLIDGATPTTLHSNIDLQVAASDDLRYISAHAHIADNYLSTESRSTEIKDFDITADLTPEASSADVSAGDLTLHMDLAGDVGHLSQCLSDISDELSRQLAQKAIDQEALRRLFPTMSLSLHAHTDNPLHNYMRFQGTDLGPVDVELTTDTLHGINGEAHLGLMHLAGMQIDTVYARITQDADGIKLKSAIRNFRRDNPNRFTATLNANLMATGFGADARFEDEKGRVGTDLKMQAEMADGQLSVRLDPSHNVFAYHTFDINRDNFLSISKQGRIRADVRLVAEGGTGLSIYSEPTDDTTNDVTLSVSHLSLDEVCAALPYLPRLEGMVNGDFHVIEEHEADDAGKMTTTSLSAMGTLEAEGLAYEGMYIGNVGSEIIYLPKENGEHYADAFITYNGTDVGECSGVYYDTDDHFSGDVRLTEFPLTIVNAFLDGTDFMMRGSANGTFNLQGTLDRPTMNGTLSFDDAHFYSNVYGVDFRMEERPLVFADSRLEFQNYLLTSGKTDLKVNGNIDFSDVSDARLDLTMAASGFELINTKRTTSSLVYGKVLADYRGTVRGCMDDLIVRGQLDILPSTDATYLLTNSPLTVEDRLADLVTFMDFADTTHIETVTDAAEMMLDVTLGINIADGAKFHCFLSANGSSYVDVRGGGNLTLRMTRQGDMRLTGRYTIQEGEMNYELPVIPLKKFSLTQGSFVEFTGEMMNPQLSIAATEETRAVVSDEDVQRNVDFIVGVNISRTLQDMGLAFTIEAPEDLAVQNQLAAMSEEDRYKSAVALLATGMFVTENLTSGLKASNALNAFLQNEIQNIAGKALSTFDLSFGMENGTSSRGTTTTDYSFRFSKRFLDDRISVNIGGSVSTGSDAQNDAASFIDNISIEYRLDNSATRYVRVFYDRDSHDLLEGAMMKAGAGLVLRRKTDRLGELFLFRRKK